MPQGIDYLDFSRWLLRIAVGLNVATLLCVGIGVALKDRRWVHGARNALWINAGVLVGASTGLLAGFVLDAYQIEYIFSYSEKGLPLNLKLVGLWAGLDGSILFWAMLLGLASAAVAFGYRREQENPVGRHLEPYVYAVLACIQLFFVLLLTTSADPFSTFADGVVPDNGKGLNPQLDNYWMQIHPPSLYVGWVLYTVPFAFGIAALITGQMGNYWIRKVRRWMLVAWLFNTAGCIMGGLWAYETLGWGGYWAWDPVENASCLPWFTATAFLHSVMVQERRDMLKVWNAFLICATFALSIVGTWLTRSGVVSSVHAFASGAVGDWFLYFLLTIVYVSLFLIMARSLQLRSKNRIESLVSREAIFIYNNMILLALGSVILVLTLWPKITHEFPAMFGGPVTVGPPVFQLVTTPLFALLLLFTAIGPGMAWISTSRKQLWRHFGWPALAAVPLALGIQALAWISYEMEPDKVALLDGVYPHGLSTYLACFVLTSEVSLLTHIYPAGVINYLACFVLTTLAFEVWRTTSLRARARGIGLIIAATGLLVKDNRRYGGYMVHVGIACIAIAILNSSVFATKDEKVELQQGDRYHIGKYELHLAAVERDVDYPVFRATRLTLEVRVGGVKVATMDPERRFYRQQGQSLGEPKIRRGLLEDLYVFFEHTASDDTYSFTFYRKPYMWGFWAGWIVMMLGGLWAALPMGRRRIGLAE